MEKKNILLISTIYPLPGKSNRGTKVCHYFAQEWMKMGYNVRVIHLQAVYPRPLYWIAKFMGGKIAAKTGAVVYTKRDNQVLEYEMDSVPVARVPAFKPVPHGGMTRRSVRKSVSDIILLNEAATFVPDVVIGHFTNPVIEVVGKLKLHYSGSRSCVVVHGDVSLTKKIYAERLPELMKDIDVWGFRCKHVRELWERKIGPVEHPFICYSGIPADYVTEDNRHDFSKPLHDFIYVGEMIERKYPSRIIDALETAYPDGNYRMTYVGDGEELATVRQAVANHGAESRYSILGRIPRIEIKKHYDEADCFIMISRGEAYGLVYLEAMARGCITVASRHEGFDGVIEDGVNGFLCKSGDSAELASIIVRINALTPEERRRISEKAVETAAWLTDMNAAKMYIEDVIGA